LYPSSIIYKTGTAQEEDVLDHLQKCKNNFIPALDKTVDIPKYAKKIAESAVSFEAWDGQELIGLIAAYFNDVVTGLGFITNVSCLTGFTGIGIGSQLLKNCMAYGEANGFKKIMLEVNKINLQAIKLYERHGFNQCSIKGELIIMEYTIEKK